MYIRKLINISLMIEECLINYSITVQFNCADLFLYTHISSNQLHIYSNQLPGSGFIDSANQNDLVCICIRILECCNFPL